MDVTITPSKQKKGKYGNVKLRSVTTTGSTTTGPYAITPIAGDPGAIIYYDKDVKFDNKGLAKCSLSQLEGTLPQVAQQRCSKAQVGTGQLTVGFAGSPDPLAETGGSILAFNGPTKNGHPILYLHVRVPALANTTILTATLLKVKSGKYGWRLNVKVDPLPNGAAAKVFDVTVGRKPWVTKRTKIIRRGNRTIRKTIRTKHFYVAAKCSDPKWDYKGRFIYKSNGGPVRSGSLNTTDSQPCTVKR
jgi:hypothetical protein